MACICGKLIFLGCPEPVEGQPDSKSKLLALGFDPLSPTYLGLSEFMSERQFIPGLRTIVRTKKGKPSILDKATNRIQEEGFHGQVYPAFTISAGTL
jgi:hypothetical protein